MKILHAKYFIGEIIPIRYIHTSMHTYIQIYICTCIKTDQECRYAYICILHIPKYIRIKMDIYTGVHSAHICMYIIRTYVCTCSGYPGVGVYCSDVIV